MNYEFLAELYGVVSRRRGRHLRSSFENKNVAKDIPHHIQERLREVVTKLEKRMDDNAHEDGWKLLHRKKHGEEHEMDLGDGYKVRVHMLLA